MRTLTATVVLLACVASACNRTPAPAAASHPPAIDLETNSASCPAEPAALTEEQAAADAGDVLEGEFNDSVMLAGRACRDAHRRICLWHKERGAQVTCAPPPRRPN